MSGEVGRTRVVLGWFDGCGEAVEVGFGLSADRVLFVGAIDITICGLVACFFPVLAFGSVEGW